MLRPRLGFRYIHLVEDVAEKNGGGSCQNRNSKFFVHIGSISENAAQARTVAIMPQCSKFATVNI